MRDTESLDLNEALVRRVPEPLDHGGPILRTLDTPGVGIDGVELGAAVGADDRLAFIDESIVGAGATLGQRVRPKAAETIQVCSGRIAALERRKPDAPKVAETPGAGYGSAALTS